MDSVFVTCEILLLSKTENRLVLSFQDLYYLFKNYAKKSDNNNSTPAHLA